MIETQTLNGFWQFRQADRKEWLPANVPGGVHTDLITAGEIPDPFYGTNEEQLQWVAEKNWEYRKFFYPTQALLQQEHIGLVCEGLDTLAEVRLNGRILGQANNMFRPWRWEIKSLLKEGENKLEILFRSPVQYVRSRERVKRMRAMDMGIRGGPHMRKSPSHFGWDWGPRLPCIGIWQDIRIEGRSRGRLDEVRFDQEHGEGVVNLTARVQCELWEADETRHSVRLRISGPDRQVWQLDSPARPQTVMTVTIANPELWWPNGHGPQTLYSAEVELIGSENEVIDTRTYHLGLRTLSLQQEEDAHGKSFSFIINGQPIFCKGANWIPADTFPTRITPERVESLIRDAAEANQNMLRVWGGGYYESDTFYDLCDRYGILVWQDFLFACATYPLDDPGYLDNVRAEVIANVRRLRHHASLALWCGNNEIEWLGARLGWFRDAKKRETYTRFFFNDLPALVAAEDPAHPYWPGSPSSGDPFNHPGGGGSGDAHLWEVYHEFRQPLYYRKQNPRFVSEFGFQALPTQATIEEFCPEDDRALNSRVMACHQRALAGNTKLTWYLAQRFRLPRGFDGVGYLSQIFQAEAIRTAVEHWRRHPEQTSGALYWQLNDCWPVTSWSSIDYFGRWKALHYAARRFFAPVMLSVEDQLDQGQRKMNVWVSNDSRRTWEGRAHWTLETLEGEVIEGGDQPVSSQPHSAACLLNLDFSHHNRKLNWRRMIFSVELWQGAERTALQVVPFSAEKNMPLTDPNLTAELQLQDEQLSVDVSSKRLARFVEISFEGADTRFSDNFFDLPAARKHTLTCALPAGWTLEQARANLRLRSLNTIGPVYSLFETRWKRDQALASMTGSLLWKGLLLPALRR